jgi:hypothetical protein
MYHTVLCQAVRIQVIRCRRYVLIRVQQRPRAGGTEETAIVKPTPPKFRWIITVAFVAACAGLASLSAASLAMAEDLPLPDPGELELPGDSFYPGGSFGDWSMPDQGAPEESSVMTGPAQIALDPVQDFSDCGENDYGFWDGPTAMPVSSGTWIDRGFWYAEAEAVVAVRIFDRDRTLLVADDPNVAQRTFFPPFGLGFLNLDTNRASFLRGTHPGQDASVRTTLGRFLFRDEDNRDHTAEFTAFGGGDWVQDHVLESDGPGGLFTPFPLSGGNRAFDASTRQQFTYSSRYKSFEANYRIKQRLGRDRMVMDPNGKWRREVSSGLNRNFLIGLRYIELRDTIDWTAEDIIVTGSDGQYLINTDNDMFGVQMGAGFGYESGRWSLGLSGKSGIFVNDADLSSQLNFTADDTDDYTLHTTEDELSFVSEAKILGRWHLTPGFSLRMGWEVFFLESLALAPAQINFINETSNIVTGGYSFYMGGTLGFEGYW